MNRNILIFFCLLILFSACTKGDESEEIETTISTNDLTVRVDENPSINLNLGTVQATTNVGTLSFSILEQNPIGAVQINPSSGQLIVANAELFDFETNPRISAKIKVENGDVFKVSNLTINLNDINKLTLQERLDNGEWPISIYRENPELLSELYGLTFKGGLIFHLDTKSGNTLIAAPSDPSDGAVWGCEGTNISGAEFFAVETGFTNTQAIVSNCVTEGIAAEICSNYSFGGSNEWYLPSKDELNFMYLNLKANGFGNFCNDRYWTSTEFEDQENFYDAAWVQSFKDGFQTTYDVGIKEFQNSVRAIRLLTF